jgi:hypothetical protein
MFSRAELLYLTTVSEGDTAGWERRIEERFPNPAYRRKIRWGIRRKAQRSSDEWSLFLAAAERDGSLRPRDTSQGSPPVYEDLLVELLGRLRVRTAPIQPSQPVASCDRSELPP